MDPRSPMRLLIGTGNVKKRDEIAYILGDMDLDFVVPTDLDPAPPSPAEDGDTFEKNAADKALAYASATGIWTIADDSGLVVDALDGRPGVHSARYAGETATDQENNDKLIDELRDIPDPDRGGGYVSVIVLATPERVLLQTRGTCRGRLLREPRGDGGFGYDPLFFVESLNRTFAEITPEEKGRISHRGAALAAFRRGLPEALQAAQDAS